jgi:hypothetical protein
VVRRKHLAVAAAVVGPVVAGCAGLVGIGDVTFAPEDAAVLEDGGRDASVSHGDAGTDAAQSDATLGDATPGDATFGDATLGDANVDDANPGDANPGDANVEDANVGDANVGDANLGDADAARDGGVDAEVDDGAVTNPDASDAACVGLQPTAPTTLPLDAVPGATAAYALRKLRAAYTGPLATVVRESDGASLSIQPDAEGNFPQCAVQAFANGGAVAVTKWFDQSGNGYDVDQPATTSSFSAQAPTLVLNVYGSLPSVRFAYDDESYLTGSFPWIDGGSPWSSSASLLGGVAAAASYQPIFDYGDVSSGTGHSIFGEVQSAGQFVFSFGPYGTNINSSIGTTAPSTYAISCTGTSAIGYVNGASFTGSYGAQNVSGSTFVIGGSPEQFGIWLNGDVAGLLLYPEALTGTQVATLQTADRAYYGF